MVLLSPTIGTAPVTGRTNTIDAWFARRQGGRWARQTMTASFPTAAPRRGDSAHVSRSGPREPDESLRELTDLQQRGVITDAEFEVLRARLRV